MFQWSMGVDLEQGFSPNETLLNCCPDSVTQIQLDIIQIIHPQIWSIMTTKNKYYLTCIIYYLYRSALLCQFGQIFDGLNF